MGRWKSLFVAGVVLLLVAVQVQAADITLAWDYEDDSKISGFTLYAVPVDAAFNYSMPIATVGATLRDLTVTIDTNIELKFVMRAFMDTPNQVYYSPDSNEVAHAIIIAPTSLRRE